MFFEERNYIDVINQLVLLRKKWPSVLEGEINSGNTPTMLLWALMTSQTPCSQTCTQTKLARRSNLLWKIFGTCFQCLHGNQFLSQFWVGVGLVVLPWPDTTPDIIGGDIEPTCQGMKEHTDSPFTSFSNRKDSHTVNVPFCIVQPHFVPSIKALLARLICGQCPVPGLSDAKWAEAVSLCLSLFHIVFPNTITQPPQHIWRPNKA